jgi:hypothetical protein
MPLGSGDTDWTLFLPSQTQKEEKPRMLGSWNPETNAENRYPTIVEVGPNRMNWQ